MPSFTLRTTSQEDFDCMVDELDGWDVADECMVETRRRGWDFQFTFPARDGRAAKVLNWVKRFPGKWTKLDLPKSS